MDQPDDVLALRNRGLCYHDQAKFDLALADYDKALSIAADDAATWFQRGNVFLEQKNMPEAIANYDNAIQYDAEFAKPWMNRGVARYALNQRAAAMKDLQQAQLLDDSIVLPGIDWLTAGNDTDTDTATVTEQRVTAKPIYLEAAVGGDWTEFLNIAQETLSEKGFTKLTLDASLPAQFCGRFRAEVNGNSVSVYVGNISADSSEVVLPAITDGATDQQRTLLVLTQSESSSEFTVARFVEDWKPVAQNVSPKAVTLKLSNE